VPGISCLEGLSLESLLVLWVASMLLMVSAQIWDLLGMADEMGADCDRLHQRFFCRKSEQIAAASHGMALLQKCWFSRSSGLIASVVFRMSQHVV
jgi:hypothetical protein